MSLDTMSQDKMPCRQNVTGQNALQTKCLWIECHRTKCLADKMPQDKMPCRQNVTGQNALQTKCHGTKCLADKMSQDKMPCRQNVTRTKCLADKMSLGQNVTQKKCHSDKMSLRQNVTQKNYHLLLNPSFAANKHRVGCIFFVLLQSLHGVMRGISSPLNFRPPPYLPRSPLKYARRKMPKITMPRCQSCLLDTSFIKT